MINIKSHKQGQLFDPWAHLSPKRRRMLDQSWAGLFRKQLLSELPVKLFSQVFHNSHGRPCKELHSVLGALVLQQTHDLTDNETVDQFSFNILWHYALNITEESDSAKYISAKTLWTMRTLAVENGLESILFDQITDKLATVFNVTADKQRLDSVHIKSNMQRLARISIFTKTIHKFLVNLKRHHQQLFDTVKTSLAERYISEKALQCFAMVKPSESKKTLCMVAKDLYQLHEQFKQCDKVIGMHSYKLLQRVLNEQCQLNRADASKPVQVKAPKQISCESLQNPSDPDATYSGHKGQGYQLQVMETFSTTEDKEEKSQTLNLITHVQVEKASQGDVQALKPAIESSRKRNLKPNQLQADALYGSDDNNEAAKANDVQLISPVAGNKEKRAVSLSEFTFSDKGHIITCPRGNQPVHAKKKKQRFVQCFEVGLCANCPALDQCPVEKGKNYFYLRYTQRAMRTAKRRDFENSDEFKQQYRWRAGIEATMSELDRRTGIKRLRIRGFDKVRFFATLKAAGLNILRATAVQQAMAV